MPKKYKTEPTEKQKKAFMHMKNAKSLQEAMLKAGYSHASSIDPRKNLLEREGTKQLIEQYREALINCGISVDMLAEVQTEGLMDQNAAVRLGYLKETKKDFGLQTDTQQPQVTNIQFNVTRGEE